MVSNWADVTGHACGHVESPPLPRKDLVLLDPNTDVKQQVAMNPASEALEQELLPNVCGSISRTAAWYRKHGRPSRKPKAERQQYLSSSEEKGQAGRWTGTGTTSTYMTRSPKNDYNMDETGIMLSMLSSVKVLIAVDCVSASGEYLNPIIIWPASTHQGTG
ncbi:hypothetical protein BU24DRAFT_82158 [Aaosphaeria arxii CBS 175.79]|uniref:Uncharacterized protein n=1 Tax=Aaosphaeria arxii CBS 175.79 TaxID=1450172 RepID=A0A6A5X8Q1_9PLEO|nr:uncharacterized protein BU24DRAFT_82158 [Aaosphaeria arxii CBS 175.79]KAF2009134.1 hypothetical protein BU24DRAFT_82158 [Aaosphaeria arxii CBS 175.79]